MPVSSFVSSFVSRGALAPRCAEGHSSNCSTRGCCVPSLAGGVLERGLQQKTKPRSCLRFLALTPHVLTALGNVFSPRFGGRPSKTKVLVGPQWLLKILDLCQHHPPSVPIFLWPSLLCLYVSDLSLFSYRASDIGLRIYPKSRMISSLDS